MPIYATEDGTSGTFKDENGVWYTWSQTHSGGSSEVDDETYPINPFWADGDNDDGVTQEADYFGAGPASTTYTFTKSDPNDPGTGAVGVHFSWNAMNSNETMYFYIDGVLVDLEDLIDSGDVTYIDGNGYVNDSGGITGVDGEADMNNAGVLIFNIPITTLTVEMVNANGTYYSMGVACFLAGTSIATDNGLVAVEDLSVGDRVMTMDHGYQEIRWTGARTLDKWQLARQPNLAPVRIQAGALGNGLPERDLLVSPQHRVLVSNKVAQNMFGVGEVLVAAKHLVGLTGIDILAGAESVTYVHFMCSEHEVVFSEGAPTESFFPGDQALDALDTDGREEIFCLFPELRDHDATDLFPAMRPFIKGREGRQLVERMNKNGRIPIEALPCEHEKNMLAGDDRPSLASYFI